MRDIEIIRRLESLKTEQSDLEAKTKKRFDEIKVEREALRTTLNQRTAGLDEGKIALARTVIEVNGKYDREGGCIERATASLAAGEEYMKSARIAVKDYAQFRGQQCDCEYGYGPKHGIHVFTIGLTREARARDLTEDERDAAIYYLVHLKQIQEAREQAAA